MARTVFINFAVKDLKKSVEFFKGLGFGFNDKFSNDTAACMIIDDNVYSMMMTHEKFRNQAPGGVSDTTQGNEVLTCISCESRAAVDDMVRKAVAAGGETVDEATDHGFMYDHGFQDLDGHCWGVLWMDPSFAPAA